MKEFQDSCRLKEEQIAQLGEQDVLGREKNSLGAEFPRKLCTGSKIAAGVPISLENNIARGCQIPGDAKFRGMPNTLWPRVGQFILASCQP